MSRILLALLGSCLLAGAARAERPTLLLPEFPDDLLDAQFGTWLTPERCRDFAACYDDQLVPDHVAPLRWRQMRQLLNLYAANGQADHRLVTLVLVQTQVLGPRHPLAAALRRRQPDYDAAWAPITAGDQQRLAAAAEEYGLAK